MSANVFTFMKTSPSSVSIVLFFLLLYRAHGDCSVQGIRKKKGIKERKTNKNKKKSPNSTTIMRRSLCKSDR
jgi:hypothetical protein